MFGELRAWYVAYVLLFRVAPWVVPPLVAVLARRSPWLYLLWGWLGPVGLIAGTVYALSRPRALPGRTSPALPASPIEDPDGPISERQRSAWKSPWLPIGLAIPFILRVALNGWGDSGSVSLSNLDSELALAVLVAPCAVALCYLCAKAMVTPTYLAEQWKGGEGR